MPTPEKLLELLFGPFGALLLAAVFLWLLATGKLVPGWLYKAECDEHAETKKQLADSQKGQLAAVEVAAKATGTLDAMSRQEARALQTASTGHAAPERSAL